MSKGNVVTLPLPDDDAVAQHMLQLPHRVFATGYRARLRGLIGRDTRWLPFGAELVFLQCRSVHTFFMRAHVDVAFVGPDGVVLRSERDVPACRVLCCRRAATVVERFAREGADEWYEEGEDTGIYVV